VSVIYRRRWSIHAAHRILLPRHRGIISSLLWRVIASLTRPSLSRRKARIDKATFPAGEEPRGAEERLLTVADSPAGKRATDEEVQRYESDEREEENPFDEHACASVPKGVAAVDVAVTIDVDDIVVITLGERRV